MDSGAADDDIDLTIDRAATDELLSVTPADVEAAETLTYCRNVFVPLTTACRYTCTYCTYFDPPGEADLLSPDEVLEIVETGVAAGCSEALFTFGDDPDERYVKIYDTLAEWGHESIHTYLREVCELTLDAGLLPHSNPGDQTHEQMMAVADVNASMGVMLETTADVDAHAGSRRKTPDQRLATIRTAGELRVPFTTGILVGIGERWRDRAESLLTLRALHERYGHIQEIIVQPVVENERWRRGSPSVETMRRVTAMARYALPETVSVQVPPNLAPVRELLDCGVDDLGGVSPITTDHINPDYAWPAIRELETIADERGVSLRERLPVYQRFLPDPDTGNTRWLSEQIMDALQADNEAGIRYRRVLEDSTSATA